VKMSTHPFLKHTHTCMYAHRQRTLRGMILAASSSEVDAAAAAAPLSSPFGSVSERVEYLGRQQGRAAGAGTQ
jgi:hypothetical protein